MRKLLILILFICSSCEIEYDGETKLVVKGNVKNENNQPINNQKIKLFASRNSSYLPFVFYLPSESNFIGTTSTDSSGNFTMVFPKPTFNYNEIIVELNDDSNSLNSKRIVNIKTENFKDFQLNLGENNLFSKSNLCHLQILPNQVNPEIELLEMSYIGAVANEIVYYNLPADYSYYYETEKNVRKNQTIILNYKTKNYNTNSISSQQVAITIDNSNELTYTLNY
jgi:hypothetical protein